MQAPSQGRSNQLGEYLPTFAEAEGSLRGSADQPGNRPIGRPVLAPAAWRNEGGKRRIRAPHKAETKVENEKRSDRACDAETVVSVARRTHGW